MRKCLVLLLVLLFSYSLPAQKKVPEFGKIDKADLQLSSCSFEPDASALKLFDIQQTEYQDQGYDSKLKIERRVRIKIFNEKGYQYASIKVPYFSKKGISKIKNLKAIIYRLDGSGKVVSEKLEKKDFFKEQSQENVRVVNFTFPNLKPGNVIEFSYSKIEHNMLQIDPWIIQDEIPVVYSENSLIIPI